MYVYIYIYTHLSSVASLDQVLHQVPVLFMAHTDFVHICKVLDPYDGVEEDRLFYEDFTSEDLLDRADYLPLLYRQQFLNIARAVLQEWHENVRIRRARTCKRYIMRGRVLPDILTENEHIAAQVAWFLGSWPTVCIDDAAPTLDAAL